MLFTGVTFTLHFHSIQFEAQIDTVTRKSEVFNGSFFIHSFKDLYSTSSRKLLTGAHNSARSNRTVFNCL